MGPSRTTGLGDDRPLSVVQGGPDFPAELLQDVRVLVACGEGRLALSVISALPEVARRPHGAEVIATLTMAEGPTFEGSRGIGLGFALDGSNP